MPEQQGYGSAAAMPAGWHAGPVEEQLSARASSRFALSVRGGVGDVQWVFWGMKSVFV